MPITSVTKDPENLTLTAGPASMTFAFESTPTGSRMTSINRFDSVEDMEQTVPGMEEGLRAALPQLDSLLTEGL